MKTALYRNHRLPHTAILERDRTSAGHLKPITVGLHDAPKRQVIVQAHYEAPFGMKDRRAEDRPAGQVTEPDVGGCGVRSVTPAVVVAGLRSTSRANDVRAFSEKFLRRLASSSTW